MHKSKKKSKAVKIPQPIKVKKEKSEEERTPQPISHYVDDRLELVRQIFGTLKPKTITNLAPEFLKKKNMEEIEELCLNELLCISTKRLLSIINASKCPTDTDSDNDSDVEHKEEHISLEEISSDSEIEGATARKVKKNKRPGDASANAKKIATKNSAEKDAKDGQMSVLELLELQARARAIRSQLALEPVTKIEVDSDDDDEDDEASRKSSKNQKSSRNKRKSIDKERTTAADKTRTTSNTSAGKQPHSKSNGSTEPSSTGNSDKETAKRSGRKIKLKRDYSASVQEKNEIEASIAGGRILPFAEPTASKEVKMEAVPSRSPSPDVIQIVAETETLLISDSSDMEEEKAVAAAINPVDRNTLVVKVSASNERQVTKTSQSEKTQTENQVTEKPAAEKLQPEQPQNDSKDENKRARKLTEPEEGELSENETNDVSVTSTEKDSQNDEGADRKTTKVDGENLATNENDKNPVVESVNDKKPAAEGDDCTAKTRKARNDGSSSSSSSSESETETREKKVVQVQQKDATEHVAKTIEIISNIVVEELPTATPTPPPAESTNVPATVEDEDDQNDDVISIEGGDLENEMIEHLEAEKKADAKKKVSPKPEPEPQDEDIISLDSSEDERSQSWHSRYLKSSKVNKVLLTSRLGKRVRDNIKKSKRSKKDSTRGAVNDGDEAAVSSKSSGSSVFTSQHEDGSVEQYKELLEMRPRKTKE